MLLRLELLLLARRAARRVLRARARPLGAAPPAAALILVPGLQLALQVLAPLEQQLSREARGRVRRARLVAAQRREPRSRDGRFLGVERAAAD